MIKIRGQLDNSALITILIVISLYIGLRVLCWNNTVLLEDTDSISYLQIINGFLNLNFDKYLLDVDRSPFYPFFGAVFSLPGWSVETGARLASFVFSVSLFISVFALGTQFMKFADIILGLIILSFSPILISLSFSVLTEPSYVATIYLGLWIFWKQYTNPTYWKASLLGVIFGLAFLNRVEGILFLAIVPFWEICHYFFFSRTTLPLKKVILWIFVYVFVFALVVSPQIYKVSKQLDGLALNGRQVWTVVYNKADDKSRIEKVFGLDYSPKELNIHYLSKNPETLKEFKSDINIKEFFKTILREFNVLYQKRLGELIGPLCIIFFAFGIISLYQMKKRYEVFLLITFIGFNLAGPLFHNVAIRHIISIAPIIFLISGVGISYLVSIFSGTNDLSTLQKRLIPIIIIFITVSAWVMPLRKTFKPKQANHEYSPIELSVPISIIKKISENELGRSPNITAERGYLAYFSNGNQFYLPFTKYEKFVTYCELNNVDFFYLNHHRVKSKKYPFYEHFQIKGVNNFDTIYSGFDFHGQKVSLFRYKNSQNTVQK